MQVFEFHFNPQLRPNSIFDSFCYEPENIYEKRMGNLYLAGRLKNILPQNLHFLDKLAKVIQKEYYRSTIRKSEKALKESLKEANEFLEQIAKKGDVSWLGNLSFAVLSLKNYELNFTKVGDLKIFLLRGRRIIDIDRKLKFEEIEPYPLKIFGNIVSGKLAEGDILLVSTKEVTDFFEKENLLPEIGKIWPVAEKGLREIFDKRKEEILKISGLCLIIVLTKEAIGGKKQIITPKTYPKEFNLREIFSPYLKKISAGLKGLVRKPRLRLPVLIGPAKLGKFPNVARTLLGRSLRFHLISRLALLPRPRQLNKKIILILALIFFLALGFFIAQVQQEKELKEGRATLNKIQEKVNQAESYLILKTPPAEKTAGVLLKESWEEISQLSKIVSNLPQDFQGRVFSLKDEVSKILLELNKLETIEEPELFFDFGRREFFPQKMVFFRTPTHPSPSPSGPLLYFFSPYSENLFKVDKNAQGEIIEIAQKFNFAAPLEEIILFFSKPNQLSILKGREIFSAYLKEPYPDFSPNSFSTFRGHLYFFDKKSGQIIKYPYLGNLKWGSPQLWLLPQTKKAMDSKSMAVDGSIWILNKNNFLTRYYAGRLQQKIVLEIFPQPKEFKKIFTSPTLPYLYLLEPIQNRIVILNKSGQIVKQFQSQKFDNLLDFSISADGKTIYLLNGLRIYKINL